MLSSIHPLGERGRNNRFGVTATAHVVGATLGGALTGTVAATVGWLVTGGEAAPMWSSLLIVSGALLADLVTLRVPSSHRQVNERWIETFRGTVYGSGFGFQLGLGVITIVPTWLVPATVVTAALTASWWAGALVGAVFGMTRGAMLFTVRNVHDVDALRRYHRQLHQHHPKIRTTLLVSVALTGAAAGALT